MRRVSDGAGALPLRAPHTEMAQFVALRAAACVGAEYSNMALLTPAGALRLFHGPFLDPVIADRYTDMPLDAPYPIAVAAREQVPVLLPDLESYQAQFSAILPDTIAAGVQATASLPLHRANGSLLGAMGFAWRQPTPFDAKIVNALTAVGYFSAETVERAERYDAEHQLLVELQGRLLGELPSLIDIDTAAAYLPASSDPAVGGDWYEAVHLDHARVAFVVGDVTGHGVAAAADMALIRGMISALLYSGVPAAEVFTAVSGVLAQRAAFVLATAALVIVDVAAETLTFTTAGHPPPILQLPNGDVRLLDTANGPLIGIAKTKHSAETVPFPRGSRLIMFTDGLVERRDRGFDDGVQRLAAHLALLSQSLTASQVVASILNTLIGTGEANDDIAILAITHTQTSSEPLHS